MTNKTKELAIIDEATANLEHDQRNLIHESK